MDNTFDKMFYMEGDHLAGVDESGVSDLAGPLVAACVILPRIDPRIHDLKIFEICDSKATPKALRKSRAEIIWQTAIAVGIGEVQPSELDFFTRQQAISLAHIRAVQACKHTVKGRHIKPDFMLVDGDFAVPLDIKQATLRKLDTKSLCCASASIIAKVYRDDIMSTLHESFPYYGWTGNKGFPDEAHFKGLDEHGIQVGVHRISAIRKLRHWAYKSAPEEAGQRRDDRTGEFWDMRIKEWIKKTYQRSGTELGGNATWTLNPPLWQPSMNFSDLHPRMVRLMGATKPSKKPSKEQATPPS
jgi:ribonuclease HII